MKRNLLAAAMALAALACGRREPADPGVDARQPAAVPGIETAVARTAPTRDVIAAFGSVSASGELDAVRDARTALAEAEARLTLALQQRQRVEGLAGIAVASRKELDTARAEEAAARAAVRRSREIVAAFGSGVGGDDIVAADETWVTAHVLQVDVPRVAAGGPAVFVPDALPDARLTGTVDAPPAYVDPVTTTAPVRLRIHDGDARLRPGMTGRVTLDIGVPRNAVLVPAPAVVYDDAQALVFVADGGRYRRQDVQLGALHDGSYEVRAGLGPGTSVVVVGAPSLLSASRLAAGGVD